MWKPDTQWNHRGDLHLAAQPVWRGDTLEHVTAQNDVQTKNIKQEICVGEMASIPPLSIPEEHFDSQFECSSWTFNVS